MDTSDFYHVAVGALNALQNAKPMQQNSDAIEFHVNAVNELKDLIRAMEDEIDEKNRKISTPVRMYGCFSRGEN